MEDSEDDSVKWVDFKPSWLRVKKVQREVIKLSTWPTVKGEEKPIKMCC